MKRQNVVTAVIVIILLGVIGWALWKQYIDGPPSDRPTSPDASRPGGKNPLPSGPLGVFQQTWDSRTQAEWPVAETLAGISDEAYLPAELASVALKKRGFTQVLPVLHGSMVCYVATGHQVAVVAFRGTDFAELNDWIVNLRFTPQALRHGQVHDGFQRAYAELGPRIVAQVRSSGAKYVWVTGHSLGGALALVCAYDLVTERNVAVTGLMTFGQPRAGDGPFSEYMNDKLSGRYVYFVNEDDIVPRIPPWYHHSGSLVWFKGADRLRTRSLRFMARGGDPAGGGPDERPTTEVPALSEPEFEALKRQIEASRRPIAMRNEKGVVVFRAATGYIQDHGIKKYIEQIHRMLHPAPPPGPEKPK
jgi:hypothetical protein